MVGGDFAALLEQIEREPLALSGNNLELAAPSASRSDAYLRKLTAVRFADLGSPITGG
jgi:hypothetical protein